MKRIFLAIKINPNQPFIDLVQKLRSELINDKIKWIDSSNLHLTLKFFGETEEVKINEINLLIDNIVSKSTPFNFEITNLGVFGSSYQPKIIWLGINKNTTLDNLTESILNALVSLGFERDRQNFVPHLTLGRIKNLADKDRFQQIINNYNLSAIQNVTVKEIYLYESILHKDGPIYNIINTYQLKS